MSKHDQARYIRMSFDTFEAYNRVARTIPTTPVEKDSSDGKLHVNASTTYIPTLAGVYSSSTPNGSFSGFSHNFQRKRLGRKVIWIEDQ
jgi:hypothetical protein